MVKQGLLQKKVTQHKKLIKFFVLSFCVQLTVFITENCFGNIEPSTTLSTTHKNLEVAPDYHKAALVNVELGLGYLSQGQVARAKSKLNHAVKLAPKIPETHSALAYFTEMVGDFKESEREHKKAISLSQHKGAVYNNYGAYLCRRARYPEADQAFHQALKDKQYERTAEVYENAGLCALTWEKEDKALEYLTTALKHDPKRSGIVLDVASLTLKQGKVEETKSLLNRYKKMAEPTARSVWLDIQLARTLKDDNAVANHAQLLKNLFSDSPEYQLYLKTMNET